MKKYTLLSFLLLLSCYGFSQCAFTVNANNPTYCAAVNGGTITVNATGGIAPFTYQLNNGTPQAANIFNNVLAGTYTIYVTDATPCTDSVIVVSTANPPVSVNINTTTPPSCVPGCDGTTTTIITGGVGAITYAISGGAMIDASGNANNLCAGTTYTVSCSDANSCTATTTVTLTLPNAPSINVNTVVPPTCMPGCDGSLTTTVSGGVPAYAYTISGGAMIDAMGMANFLCGGMVYTITVVDANACTATTTAQLLYPQALNVSITNIITPACNGGCNGAALVVASGGTPPYSYMATPGGAPNIAGQFTGLCTGTYTILVTDANGCTGSSLLSLYQPMFYFTNATNTNPTCAGITDGTINVTATGGNPSYSYLLYPGALNNVTGQFNNLASAVYTIVCADANNCTISTIINLLPPSVNFTVNTINNISCGCTGSISITNPAGGIAPYSYAINPVVNQPVPGTFDNMCGGIYTVTVSDVNNCTGTTVVNFNIIQITPTGTNSQCNGINNATINCTVLFGTAPYSFTLNPGNIVNATGNFNNLPAGIYTISVTDANLCSNTVSVTRTNNTQINVTVTDLDSVICGINGGATFIANGNANAPYTYTVQPGNIVSANGIFNGLNAGAYTLTVNNAAGCTKSNPFDIIQVSALLPVAITSNVYDESCYLSGDGAIDIIPANPNGLTYLWNTGALTPDLTNAISENYFVKITNANGDCTTVYDTVGVSGINCGTISGTVYIDSNSNCLYDNGDFGMSNVFLSLSNGALALTNMNGSYQFSNVPYGNYTVSHNANVYCAPNACTQPGPITINAGNPYISNINFKDSLTGNVDLSLYMYSTQYKPGIPNGPSGAWIKMMPMIMSSMATATKITLVLNDSLNFDYAVPSPASIVPTANGDSLTWFINFPANYGVYINNWNTPAVQVFINTPNNYGLGLYMTSCGSIMPVGVTDTNLSNNSYCVTKPTATSWDPNDKSVTPMGEGPDGNITLQDSVLDYQIRFQNTGTAEAHNIYILDTLSDKLDISSLEIIGASHAYQVEILNGNILKFKFDNIMLPDSNTNEALSHGFIAYSIKQKNTNQPGDVIHNTANIYFDFNAAVVTNTTINTIAYPTRLGSQEQQKSIQVYPNPATDKVIVEFNSEYSGESSVTMTNTLGQVTKTVLAKTINGKNTLEISVKELPKGIYVLKVQNGKSQGMRKLVIE